MPVEKASIAQIRERFDNDVERFSNLETGQTAAVDAAVALELVAQAASRVTPNAKTLLDVGCGAGNFTLRLLRELPALNVTLVDLSEPMLVRAQERVSQAGASDIKAIKADINELQLPAAEYDVVLAAAVLHHLRDDAAWEAVFAKLCASLAPGGSIWIFDMVQSSLPGVQALMCERYGDYLTALKGTEYRDHVFDYIASEDTPRPLLYQLELLRSNGLEVEVLHVNSCFAAFGGVKR